MCEHCDDKYILITNVTNMTEIRMVTNIAKKTKMYGKNSLHSFDILDGMDFKCSTQCAYIGQPLIEIVLTIHFLLIYYRLYLG